MTYLTMYSYDFCWAVSTLREPIGEGKYPSGSLVLRIAIICPAWLAWTNFDA
jgi:hypothetical protein